jgi:hypothetical protein
MAAATTDRNTKKRGPCRQNVLVLAADAVIPFGVMVAVATPSVGADNADDVATQVVMGISGQAVSEPDGDTKILVEQWSMVLFANSGNVTAAHVGQYAMVVDNQTVGLASDTDNDVRAGIIRLVDAEGVWVDQFNMPAA